MKLSDISIQRPVFAVVMSLLLLVLVQLRHQGRVLLHQQHAGSAARGGLQPQRARACKSIQAVPAAQVLAQPIEQGFTYPVWRRAQAGALRHRQARALPLATNDAHLPCARSHFGSHFRGLGGGWGCSLWTWARTLHGCAPSTTVTMRSG